MERCCNLSDRLSSCWTLKTSSAGKRTAPYWLELAILTLFAFITFVTYFLAVASSAVHYRWIWNVTVMHEGSSKKSAWQNSASRIFFFDREIRGVARIFGLGSRPCRVEPDKHRPFNQCLTFYGPFKGKGWKFFCHPLLWGHLPPAPPSSYAPGLEMSITWQ